MSDLHLRISSVLAPGATKMASHSSNASADGPGTLDEHPMFIAAVERLTRRARPQRRGGTGTIRVLHANDPADPEPDECA